MGVTTIRLLIDDTPRIRLGNQDDCDKIVTSDVGLIQSIERQDTFIPGPRFSSVGVWLNTDRERCPQADQTDPTHHIVTLISAKVSQIESQRTP